MLSNISSLQFYEVNFESFVNLQLQDLNTTTNFFSQIDGIVSVPFINGIVNLNLLIKKNSILGTTSFSNLTMHGKPNSTTYLKATSNIFNNWNYSNKSVFQNEIINGKYYYYLIPISLNNCSPGYKLIGK